MKKMILWIIMMLFLASCSIKSKNCNADEVLTDLNYGWYNYNSCISKEAYLDIIKSKCKNREWDFNKCVQDFIDIKWIDFKINK
jgi:hypothetical protein